MQDLAGLAVSPAGGGSVSGPEDEVSIEPGILYVVATPIGNLGDLSARARETLAAVELVAAEDTRHTGRLLSAFGIRSRLLSLHEHNERSRTAELVDHLKAGASVALVSDAGTPLISDPGYRLVCAAAAAGLTVTPIPGPCAALAALSASALPTDRFVFEGFPPARRPARRKLFAGLAKERRTMVLYESPRRVAACLEDLRDSLGPERPAAVARELTKRHETISRGSLGELVEAFAGSSGLRGEVVVTVEGAGEAAGGDQAADDSVSAEKLLAALLEDLPLNRAVTVAARALGGGRNRLYRIALNLREGER